MKYLYKAISKQGHQKNGHIIYLSDLELYVLKTYLLNISAKDLQISPKKFDKVKGALISLKKSFKNSKIIETNDLL